MKIRNGRLLILFIIIFLSYSYPVMGASKNVSYRAKEGDSRNYVVNYCYSNGIFTPKLMLNFMGYFGSEYKSALNLSLEMLFVVIISEISEFHDYWVYKTINYSIETSFMGISTCTDGRTFFPFVVPYTENRKLWFSYGSRNLSTPKGILVDCMLDDWDFYLQTGSISYDPSSGWLTNIHFLLTSREDHSTVYLEYMISASDSINKSLILQTFVRISLFIWVFLLLMFVKFREKSNNRIYQKINHKLRII